MRVGLVDESVILEVLRHAREGDHLRSGLQRPQCSGERSRVRAGRAALPQHQRSLPLCFSLRL